MSIRTIASAVMALGALILVALAPTGAVAHGSVPHAHAAKQTAKQTGQALATTDAVIKVQAEVRTQAPLSADHQAESDCERGCCSAGHCSGCGTAIAPAAWTCLRLTADALVLSPDASPPAGLAREGPARPPKSFA